MTVVSAERRNVPSQNVPIPISVLSAEQLDAARIVDAAGLGVRLPTLDVQSNAGLTTASLRIRRVGNIGNIPTFEPAVGIFVDGAYRARSFQATNDFLMLDRVEVLRGPQTALYGKNVSAGLVAIHTRRPAEEFEVNGELTIGSIDSARSAPLHEASFGLSGPLAWGSGSNGARLRGGIAVHILQHDHTLKNVLPGGPDGNERREQRLRGQLLWEPTQNVDARLLYGYLRDDGDQGESDVYLAEGAASTFVSGVLQANGLTPACADNIPRNRTLCSVATNEFELEAQYLTLLTESRLANGWSLRSMTSWDDYDVLRVEDDAIQLFAPMLYYHDAERARSFQHELVLASEEHARFSWIAGAFLYRNRYERGDRGNVPMFGVNGALGTDPIWEIFLGGLPLAVPGQDGLHDSELDTDYLSAFVQAVWQASEVFSVTTHVRWQREEKDALIDNGVTVPGLSLISGILTPSQTLGGAPVNGSLSRETDDVPWSITPQYRFDSGSLLYFTLARGSKSGGFNTGFGDAPLAEREFRDEKIRHMELGTKLTLAAARAYLNVSVFRTRYDDYQDSAFIAAQFSVGNAERVELEGFEADTIVRIGDGVTLDASLSRAKLRYDTNTNGLCYPGKAPDGSSPGSCVLSGRPPIHAPDWEVGVGIQYEHPLRRGDLSIRFDWSWTDEYATSFSADPRLMQSAYSDVGLRIGFGFGGGQQEIALWGDNLLNERIVHFDSLLNLFNDESYQSYLARPRSYGLSWRFDF